MADEELDWDGALARWRTEVAEVTWVTLAEAETAADVSRSALRTWYRNGDIASRLEAGPHGDQRLVPLDAVLERAARMRARRRRPAPDVGSPLVDLLADQLRRAEERAERAEAALRDAVARAAAAEAELRTLRHHPSR